MKKHLPTLFTLANLAAGCLAVLAASQNFLVLSCIFIASGIFFDFFDGMLARKFGVASEFGVQLDSLADVVTSGVAPGIIMYKLMDRSLESAEPLVNLASNGHLFSPVNWLAATAFIISLSAAIRLARFNIDNEQTDSFIGLPTPANALFIMSFPLILYFQPYTFIENLLSQWWFLLMIVLMSAWLMHWPQRLLAFKFGTGERLKQKWLLGFLIASIGLLAFLRFLAIPIIILLYFLVSFLFYKKHGKKPVF